MRLSDPTPRSATGLRHPFDPRTRARRELALVLLLPLLVHALSVRLELHEWYSQWFLRLERWQVDELPLTFLVLTAGLAWYAWRRRLESVAALALHAREEARAAELLARNRELAQGLIALQENERRALARELHDEIGQCCTALRMETALLRRHGGGDQADLHAAAGRADAAAASIHQLVRSLLKRLRPLHLDTLGLFPALQELCEGWELRSGIACVFLPEGAPEAFDDAVAIAVYRVAQEALTNVMRHARASSVRVRLGRRGRRTLCLTVEDDGVGLDPARSGQGLGLLGAAERAAALGGRLAVSGEPGAGVRVELVLPVRAAADAAASEPEPWQQEATSP